VGGEDPHRPRGDLAGITNGNTDRHWIECLHDLGLIVAD